ncbi:hypothetical protein CAUPRSCDRAFT_12489 [Caulochytrium protostelioides]|uniref:Retrotransposon gag domain-containing protein n=1 Tax=Caulochytrium protostelioides TaxID=1555241 RepID=A0A4P9WRL2_9FUNG|nr:hypothetical protein CAUPRSCDRAFT_12489 [Caulochytrium protostelioides]
MHEEASDSECSAHVAAQQYAAVSAAPRTFRRPPRVPFDGDFKSSKVWKRKFDILLRGWPDDAKLQAVLESFEGAAKVWLDHIIETTDDLSFANIWKKIDSQWQDVQALPTLNLVEDMKRNQQKTGESVDTYAQRLQLYLAQEAGESEGDLSKPFFAKLFLSGLLAPIREKTRDLLLSADLAASYSDFVPVARKAQFIVGSFKEFQPTRRPFDGGPYKPQTAANSFGHPVTNGTRDPVDDLSNKFKDQITQQGCQRRLPYR